MNNTKFPLQSMSFQNLPTRTLHPTQSFRRPGRSCNPMAPQGLMRPQRAPARTTRRRSSCGGCGRRRGTPSRRPPHPPARRRATPSRSGRRPAAAAAAAWGSGGTWGTRRHGAGPLCRPGGPLGRSGVGVGYPRSMLPLGMLRKGEWAKGRTNFQIHSDPSPTGPPTNPVGVLVCLSFPLFPIGLQGRPSESHSSRPPPPLRPSVPWRGLFFSPLGCRLSLVALQPFSFY